jgi:hypothetical protein
MVEYTMAAGAGAKVLAVIVFVLVLVAFLFDGQGRQGPAGTRWSGKRKPTRR